MVRVHVQSGNEMTHADVVLTCNGQKNLSVRCFLVFTHKERELNADVHVRSTIQRTTRKLIAITEL